MILRPRQEVFVKKSVAALKEHGNTLGVAITAAGKTIMFSAVIGTFIKEDKYFKVLVLAHRDELTSQNQDKFLKVNPNIKTSIFDAKIKSWDGQVTFAMVQTLCRASNLKYIPKIDLLVIDEAHHSASDTYLRIINRVKEINPGILIYGLTATPNRGDKKALTSVFSNIADQITIAELIASGHLVPPKTYIIDVGTQESLKNVKKSIGDFDMGQVEEIMNKSPITKEVVLKWQKLAGERKTVIFCSTVNHAVSVTKAFKTHNINTVLIHGNLTELERKQTLSSYQAGNIQVIVNVAVLTEGWDYQPTSCIVLLRPSSFKSTMIQMIGRGLRTVDPNLYPNLIKEDCIILDFGTSSLTHGCLEVDAKLEVKKAENKDKYEGHFNTKESQAREELSDFTMIEFDLIQRSSFRWCDLFNDDNSFMACGFNAYAGVFFLNSHWYAIGGYEQQIKLLSQGKRTVCLAAADDFLNQTDENAYKFKKWLTQTATPKQLAYLPAQHKNNFNITKYHAAALLKFYFNKTAIKKLLFKAGGKP